MPKNSFKSAKNILEICSERLGDGQQIPDEVPNSLETFPKGPKVLKYRVAGYVRFFFWGGVGGQDRSPCNIG